ncbi:MAG: HAMP domain-containing protein, partial [Nitrospirae bacterium]|nr:HAMP domain-containing protein [Nitrospirota bacterium]
MKKKIIIILSLFVFFFIFGGIYIISSIEKVTSRLDSLIVLYQVEIRRERLLLELKKVQNDLSVKGTRYARSVDSVIEHFKGMKQIADTCLDCHHSEKETKRLNNLKAMINEYKGALNRTLTISANTSRVEAEQDNALRIGHDIINEVEGMIVVTNAKLEKKTQSTLKDVNNAKIMLYMLITMGPFAITGLGLFFVKSFTKPINILVDATRKLKSGDLGYRISGLKDEFGEVAASLNEMSDSLREHMFKIKESEKRYRMLFESAGDAIFMLEAEGENAGKIVSANIAASEMHGYTIDEMLRLSMIKDLDTPEAAKGAPGRIERMLNGEWIKAEIEHCKKD